MFWQWVIRILGYGLAAGAAAIGQKHGLEIGTAVGTLGGVVLNKASSYIVPRRESPKP